MVLDDPSNAGEPLVASTRMDDPRYEPGMPVLDRQPVGADRPRPRPSTASPRPPRRRSSTTTSSCRRPALVAGVIAITALETGSPLSSPLVKACVVIGAPLLIIANADAILRIWRSAWAWMPVNRDRGLFRLAWVAAGVIGLLAIAAAAAVVLAA